MRDQRIKTLGRVLKAMANERRLAIIKLLDQKQPKTVGEIAEVISLSFPATSRHLSLLEKADILDKEQISTEVYYKLNPEWKRTLFSNLTKLRN